MDNDNSKIASLCTGGCGFYGSEVFNNMCSKCFKDSQMAKNSENDNSLAVVDSNDASTTTTTTSSACSSSSSPTSKPALAQPTSTTNTTAKNTTITTDNTAASSRPSRKHRRSPSPIPEKKTPSAAAASGSVAPSTAQPAMAAASAANEHQRPPQLNKGKCYQCRAKVPLVKQTTNKCRCQYIFCDSHRYPDRHDCFIDFGELDRAELAKNNPKLHERPAGGRSFRRIDSL